MATTFDKIKWQLHSLKQEIEDFKKKIDFDGIVKEREEDMKISREMRKAMKNKPSE